MHLSKDEEEFSRIDLKYEGAKIQTIFETLQAQISNLKLHEQENCWFSEQVDWTDVVIGRMIHYLTDQFLSSFYVKYTYSVILFCVFVKKILIILKRQENGKPIHSATSTKVQNIDLSTTSQFERVEFVRHRSIFRCASRICLRKEVCSHLKSTKGSSSCPHTTTLT